MAEFTLTAGAIEAMSNPAKASNYVVQPVLQILSIKKLTSNGTTPGDRHRVVISDGVHHYMQALLGTSLAEVAKTDAITRFTVVRVKKFVCSPVVERTIVILMDVDILGTPAGKIGDPKPYEVAPDAGAVAGGAAAGAPTSPAGATNGAAAPVGAAPAAPKVSPYRQYTDAATGAVTSAFGARVASPPRAQQSFPAFDPNKTLEQIVAEGQTPETLPIAYIYNTMPSKFIIRARVTLKHPVREFARKNPGPNNQSGGRVCSIDLKDDSSEIRATAFNEQIDTIINSLEVGKAYYFSKMSVKPANRMYNTLPSDYELTFEKGTQWVPCHDEANLPQVVYNFVRFDGLETLGEQTVDLIGICKSARDVQTITTKQQKSVPKRELTLVDQSQREITVTLWNTQATNFDEQVAVDNRVLAFRKVKLTDFSGVKSASCISSSAMEVEPDMPETQELRAWFDSEGRNQSFQQVTGGAGAYSGGNRDLATFQQINSNHSLGADKAEYARLQGTVTFLKTKFDDKSGSNDGSVGMYYYACGNIKQPIDNGQAAAPNSRQQAQQPSVCGKKLAIGEQCPTCGDVSQRISGCNLTFVADDSTGSQWITAFRDTAQTILGASNKDLTLEHLHELALNGEQEQLDSIYAQALHHPYEMTLRIKQEQSQQGGMRTRYQLVRLAPIDFARDSLRLVRLIQAYN
ncbi:replication protein A [Capsaspora owczarzaki ATCC 30864]|uniref:Replication protein A n=1 Tax=Capsaspora owczarzaki (strain ATCC 30864) TaxID=595528 RepID=A0A0D2UA73_CAPO3|nr:replication protein A [Capsaspora owczarzaki ATCC 30864]KJE91956.1 replication protein A [Capsaspora owczarzaki ATCC 30864]|eukprot:XP_004363840.1 replication protein A [Capsaspora owczarzaki ATCC 30864]